MSDRVFLDTNVLIYAIEKSGGNSSRAHRARELVKRSGIVLSTQVLGEFYNAATSQRRISPLSHSEAVAWIQLWKRNEVEQITIAHVDLALEIKDRFQTSYYDALIIAAARLANVSKLLSEDLNDQQDYGGVLVVNPFTNS